MKVLIGGLVAAVLGLSILSYALAADRRVLRDGENVWRKYTEAQGWRQYIDHEDGRREWSDWWMHRDQYPLEPRGYFGLAGACRYTGYHTATPEGDILVGGRICAHPFGAFTIVRDNTNSSCQPGARDWPQNEAEASRMADRICHEMRTYAQVPE